MQYKVSSGLNLKNSLSLSRTQTHTRIHNEISGLQYEWTVLESYIGIDEESDII